MWRRFAGIILNRDKCERVAVRGLLTADLRIKGIFWFSVSDMVRFLTQICITTKVDATALLNGFNDCVSYFDNGINAGLFKFIYLLSVSFDKVYDNFIHFNTILKKPLLTLFEFANEQHEGFSIYPDAIITRTICIENQEPGGGCDW